MLAKFVPEARQSIDEIGQFVVRHIGYPQPNAGYGQLLEYLIHPFRRVRHIMVQPPGKVS